MPSRCISAQFQPTPLVLRKEPINLRRIKIELHLGVAVEFAQLILMQKNKPIVQSHDYLAEGRHSFLVDIEEVSNETEVNCEFWANGACLYQEKITVHPVKPWTVHLMHQSHFDIGYTDLQREICTLQKTNIDQVLEYIQATEDYPDDSRFRWTVECTYPLLQYLEDRPASQIQSFIRQVERGRIEVAACLFTLHAEFCSPEELIRSFYPVAKLREMGIPIQTAIQSDVPGTVSILPRILNNIGIRYLAMAPNNHRAPFHPMMENKLPRPFYWSSGYGDQVLTWYTDLPDHVYQEGNILGFLENLETVEARLPLKLQQLEAESFAYHDLGLRIQGSYSDNGRPNLRIAEIAKEWNEKYAYPKVRCSTFGEVLRKYETATEVQIPVIAGEWPNWWAEGVGSAARELSMIRKAQDRTMYGQNMYALATAGKKNGYPRERLDQAWNLLLLSNEHTWGAALPKGNDLRGFGSGDLQWGTKKSYMYQADLESDRLEEGANYFLAEEARAAESPSLLVFNSLSWARTDVVRIPVKELEQYFPGSKGWKVFDRGTNKEIRLQYCGNGLKESIPDIVNSASETHMVFVAGDVPAYGYRSYDIQPVAEAYAMHNCSVQAREIWKPKLDNAFYSIEICPVTGGILSVYDKELRKNVVKVEHPYRFNQVIHRKMNANHMYFIEDELDREFMDVNARVELLEKGPVFDRLVVAAECGAIKVKKEIILYHAIKRIDLVVWIDKPYTNEREAVFIPFPFAVEQGQIRVETVGDHILPGINQLAGSSTDWYVARKYVDISNDSFGITVALIDSPMIQVGDIRKASVRNDHADASHLYIYLMNNLWQTNFPPGQGGEMKSVYSLGIHDSAFNPVSAERFSAQVHTPLRSVLVGSNRDAEGQIPSQSTRSWIVSNNSDNVMVTGVSKTGDFIIIRITEFAGEQGSANLSFPLWTIIQAFETNLIEEEVGALTHQDNVLQLALQPKEIKTIKIYIINQE